MGKDNQNMGIEKHTQIEIMRFFFKTSMPRILCEESEKRNIKENDGQKAKEVKPN